jgi:hypothetical protein
MGDRPQGRLLELESPKWLIRGEGLAEISSLLVQPTGSWDCGLHLTCAGPLETPRARGYQPIATCVRTAITTEAPGARIPTAKGTTVTHENAAHSRAVLEGMWELIRTRDFDRLEEVLHPDFVQEIPQSGERIVGVDNFRNVVKNLPGGGPGLQISEDPYFAGSPEHYVMTPTFNVVKVQDSGDEITSYVRLKYPDGSDWYVVTFSSYKDGKMVKRVDFYAPFFEPPPWRADWAEKID